LHFSDDGSYDLSIERKNSNDFSGESSSSSLSSFNMFDGKHFTEKNKNQNLVQPNIISRFARTLVEYELVNI
jgi:hypothetical protein